MLFLRDTNTKINELLRKLFSLVDGNAFEQLFWNYVVLSRPVRLTLWGRILTTYTGHYLRFPLDNISCCFIVK